MKKCFEVETVKLENGQEGLLVTKNELFKIEKSKVENIVPFNKKVKVAKPERGVI